VRCDECGFDYDAVAAHVVPDRLRAGGRDLAAALHGDVRARPADGVWSQLEYACHVRDVLRVQRDRVEVALREDRPENTPMRRDERAVEERYNEQDVDEVRTAVVAGADDLADRLAALSPEELARTVIYGYPERAERTIAWVGIHTVHELVHHTMDVGRR
jgi:S-DNA-T family DNA segregation ATPase FtsK/SpoIIIE